EHAGAAHPLRSARRALAGAAGALLLPRLLAAAADLGAPQRRGVAAALLGALRLDHFPQEVFVHLHTEDGVVEVEITDLRAVQIFDFDLCHDSHLPFSPL